MCACSGYNGKCQCRNHRIAAMLSAILIASVLLLKVGRK